mgnify:CR=1 FL=1
MQNKNDTDRQRRTQKKTKSIGERSKENTVKRE